MTLKWHIHSSGTDHAALVEQIEAERREVGADFPNTRLTRSWILQKSLIEGAHAYHIRDIVWAFPYAHRVAVLVEVPKGVAFVMSDGTDVEIQMDSQEAASVLRYLAERIPWAVIGFDSDIEQLYRQDAGAFIGEVLARRARLESGEQAPNVDDTASAEDAWCPYCAAPVPPDARLCPRCDGPLHDEEDEDQVDA